VSPYNFGADENILTKLFQAMCREAGLIAWVQFLVGSPPKIWEAKMSKIRHDFWQLSILIANISGKD